MINRTLNRETPAWYVCQLTVVHRTVRLTRDRHCLCRSTGRTGVPQALSALIPDDGGAYPVSRYRTALTQPSKHERSQPSTSRHWLDPGNL